MASHATKHFVMQRFTAIIQVPLVLWLVVSIIQQAGASREEFMAWLADPLTAGLMILFFLSVCFHMHLGMGEVIDDYIHKKHSRAILMMLNRLYALVLGSLGLFSVIAITLIV